MSEAGLWGTMRQQMGANKYWREATRHEDLLSLGIADVSYVSRFGNHGWIELKKINEWPKRESTIVRIDHYTDDQRMWLKRKGKAGGFTWLFLQIKRDYFLFDWYGAQTIGLVPRKQLDELSYMSWYGKMNWEALSVLLCDGSIRSEV